MMHAPVSWYDKRLLRRLSFGLFRRYAKTFKDRYSVERRMGAFLLLDQLNKVDMHLLCGGVWEPDRIHFLRDLIVQQRRSDEKVVFLDIGAHGALYLLVLDPYVRFDRMIAYEPEPSSLAQIRANLMMNDLVERVEVIPKAVSDEEGSSQFTIVEQGNRGESRIVEGASENRGHLINVSVTTVDATFSDIGVLLVAKIDVEGHENKVVRGMLNALRNNRVILQIEKNTDDLADLERSLRAIGVERVHSISQDHYFVKT